MSVVAAGYDVGGRDARSALARRCTLAFQTMNAIIPTMASSIAARWYGCQTRGGSVSVATLMPMPQATTITKSHFPMVRMSASNRASVAHGAPRGSAWL